MDFGHQYSSPVFLQLGDRGLQAGPISRSSHPKRVPCFESPFAGGKMSLELACGWAKGESGAEKILAPVGRWLIPWFRGLYPRQAEDFVHPQYAYEY